ncbi:GMP reductase [archaeon]|nr:GMP reductase [archaeon]NDB78890.1 GMP reductase [archaeon]
MTFLDFDDVLIEPGVSKKPLTRGMVNITPDGYIPIIIANMVTTGTFEAAEIASEQKFITFLSKEYVIEDYDQLIGLDQRYIGITTGVRPNDIKKTLQIIKRHPDIGYVNIDIANVGANVEGMISAITHIKEIYDGKVVAGNVATERLAIEMQSAGADIIKVGIGSGAACLTRTEVGVGVPQFSAIQNLSKVLDIPIISDGGCKTPGDVCKAIAAGANYVMLGGMFAGCKEFAGDDGYVNFFGLGSKQMYETFVPTEIEYRPVEGRTIRLPANKSLIDVMNQLKGALRSVCTYVGVDNINDLSNKSYFIKVKHQVNRSLEKYDVS